MTKASFTPAKTKTETIEVEPAKVVLEMSVREAQELRAVLGKLSAGSLYDMYLKMGKLHGEHNIPKLFVGSPQTRFIVDNF